MSKNIYKLFLFLFVGIISGNSFASMAVDNLISSHSFRDNADGSRTLLHHMPREVNSSTLMSHVDPGATLDLRVLLPLQNQTQLSNLIRNIYDSQSAVFHQYLNPDQFVQQFGASQTDIIETTNFLKSQGLSVTRQSNSYILNVSGPVSAVEGAFGLHMNNYKKGDGTLFFAPDADPSIPAPMVGKILAISGLQNLTKLKFLAHQNKVNAQASPQTWSGPSGYVAPSDIIKAYNLNAVPADGSGQTVALVEFDGYYLSDIQGYDNYFNIPLTPAIIQNKYIDGFNGQPSGGPDNGSAEVTLDIEILNAIATHLSSILVYEASNNYQTWIDEWTAIANDDLAHVVSCSWAFIESEGPTSFDNTLFQQMAAQGQQVFVASGDNGAYNGGTTLSVTEPAAQPNVTGVGISVLTVNSDGSYNSETASNNSGGGISALQTIPDYQKASIIPFSSSSTTMRNVPDLALTADSTTPYAFYIGGFWGGWWGSSIASPIWAAFNALVNEGRAQAGESTLGFINPIIYSLAQGSNSTQDFHDIVGGINGYYPATKGYDDATGLGSFNGVNLYNDLVAYLPPPKSLSALASPSSIALSWQFVPGALTYNVKRADILAGPYAVIASGLGSPNYTDNAVAGGQLYYYVVSAVNMITESQNSAAVSSMPGAVHTITASAGANGAISPSGAISVNNWSNQSFTVIANNGYGISQLLVDGASISLATLDSYTYAFKNVTQDHTIQASFLNDFYITPSVTTIPSSATGGSISPSVRTGVIQNQSQSFIMTPASNYILGELLVDGSAVTIPINQATPFTYVFNNVNTAHTINPVFVSTANDNLYVSSGNNGQISPSGFISLSPGTNQTFNIYPIPGYTVSKVLVDQTAVTPQAVQPNVYYTYTVSNISASHAIAVSFVPISSNTVTASADSNGTITPSGAVNVNVGSNQSFTITPNTGYASFVSIDGSTPVPLPGNSYTLSNVIAPHTINAYFAPVGDTILSVSAQSLNVIISPSGIIDVPIGSNQTFTVTPTGSNSAVVSVDGATPLPALNNSFTMINVTSPHSLTAYFVLTVPVNTTIIVASVTGAGGTISPSGAVGIGLGPMSHISFNFIPLPYYNFSQVVVDGSPETAHAPTSGDPYYSYSFSNIGGPHTISASFTPIIYALTASAGAGGSISPSGGTNITYGANQAFIITPNAGYSISHVFDGATDVTSTLVNNTFTLTNITAAHTITASFIQPQILSGSPSGPQPFEFSIFMNLTTNENMTCKYAQANGPPGPPGTGPSYAALPNTFAQTGGTTHSQGMSAIPAIGVYQYYYVMCQDASGNFTPNNYVIGFVVSPPPPPTNASVLSVNTVGKKNVLSWTASVAGTGVPVMYEIFRVYYINGKVLGSFGQIGATGSLTWTDSATQAGIGYQYYVLAFVPFGPNPASQGVSSNTVTVRMP